MRVALLETVKTNGGFEQEFDRLIINELKKQGHRPVLYLPENSSLSVDFGIPIEYMNGGTIVDYEGVGRLKKMWLSVKRETRRVKWFDAAYEKACAGKIDAILLTTATYRYLRSLHKSKLKNSPVPVIFVFLGVNHQEKPKFVKQSRQCLGYPNIKLKIITLRNDFAADKLSNVEIIKPPVLVPLGISVDPILKYREPIRIGFFGHYRKGEKNISSIIEAFIKAEMTDKAELIVQVAPTEKEDTLELQCIMDTYAKQPGVAFLKGKLQGKDWYDALKRMDILFLPYSNTRYLYNWSAVYFNALGLYKPVWVTKVLNPEILAEYDIGIALDLEDRQHMSERIHDFLADYAKNISIYQRELERANRDFGTAKFLQSLLQYAQEK